MMGLNRATSFWAVVLILAVGVGCFLGCRDDINVPFPPSIVGEWKGIYTYKQDGGAVSIDTSQLVTFRFTASIYQEAMDTSIPDTERVFCGVLGEYELRNGITMDQIDSNVPPSVCTFHQNPYGTFGINFPENDADTLRMLHDSSDNGVRMQKLIRLVRTK